MGARKAEAAALLFIGGGGNISLRLEEGQVRFSQGNFLPRAPRIHPQRHPAGDPRQSERPAGGRRHERCFPRKRGACHRRARGRGGGEEAPSRSAGVSRWYEPKHLLGRASREGARRRNRRCGAHVVVLLRRRPRPHADARVFRLGEDPRAAAVRAPPGRRLRGDAVPRGGTRRQALPARVRRRRQPGAKRAVRAVFAARVPRTGSGHRRRHRRLDAGQAVRQDVR